jgi:hypothetical protein
LTQPKASSTTALVPAGANSAVPHFAVDQRSAAAPRDRAGRDVLPQYDRRFAIFRQLDPARFEDVAVAPELGSDGGEFEFALADRSDRAGKGLAHYRS